MSLFLAFGRFLSTSARRFDCQASLGARDLDRLAIYTLLKTGLEGPQSEEDGDKRPRTRFLPDNIYDAIRLFKGSRFMQEVMGEEVHAKFAELKLAQAERCPKALGTL
ncbi:MAG TPA: hypothetical protein VF173_21275, partial [Thermoanaerobaculia bacterium]|nr:hypothetical protein [Thermoanaerobaculia bacterium]